MPEDAGEDSIYGKIILAGRARRRQKGQKQQLGNCRMTLLMNTTILPLTMTRPFRRKEDSSASFVARKPHGSGDEPRIQLLAR